MTNISRDGKNRCVTGTEAPSFQTPQSDDIGLQHSCFAFKLFVKAGSINKEPAESIPSFFLLLTSLVKSAIRLIPF